MITPVALFLLLAAVIPGSSDDGTSNVRTNVSFTPSANISSITGTLTLLIVIPLSNVAVSGVVLKSTPPVSQTLFTQHIIIHITLLPSADTDDFSDIDVSCDGVTVTLNGLTDVPLLVSSSITNTNPAASDPVNILLVNLTLMSTVI